MMTERDDRWAEWFLHPGLESGGERYAEALRTLGPIRDRVIAGAGVSEGSVVVDIGSGSGLIAFALADIVGSAGHLHFVDISRAMLDHCQSVARERGIIDRCTFLEASVLDLGAIPDSAVDAVTIRSVLIYVRERKEALRELHRILKPGGRLSIYEPAIRYHAAGGVGESSAVTARSIEAMLAPLLGPEAGDEDVRSAALDLDQDELLDCAEGCGFSAISLKLEIDVARGVYFTGAIADGASQPATRSVMHRTAGIYLRGVK